ncbi:MAG: septum site-determining protein MinD [Oscillospiraceae bacterium]|nr:septum site-determining protein MinD [Oscillospiraceae bacterium]
MGFSAVVTSGKGGAGKSTITAGVGYSLASLGKQVLLVDGDAGLRSLDLMLGIGSAAVYDMSDIFAGNCEPGRAVYPSPLVENLYVIPAPGGLERMCTPAEMKLLCSALTAHFDVILIDCPAGMGAGFEASVAGAERALVVTTPDMVCARDAEIIGGLLDARNIPAHLLINRVRISPILKGYMPNLDTIIDVAGLQLMGVIPEDEEVAIATANGEPIPTDCNAALCFANIARRLLGENVPLAAIHRM